MIYRKWRTGLVLLGLLLASPVQGLEYDIADYQVRMEVLEGGDLMVEEEIAYRVLSGTLSAGQRLLPLRRVDDIEVLSIAAVDGEVGDVEQTREGRSLRLNWSLPEENEGVRMLIRYRVSGVLTESGENNQLAWQILGGNWPVAVGNLEARLSLPADWLESPEHLSATPEAAVEAGDQDWQLAWAFGSRGAGQGQTIEVEFPRQVPGRTSSAAAPSSKWMAFGAIALGVAVILAVLVSLFLRDRQIRRAARSSPPGALPLPQAIALLNEQDAYRGQAHPALILRLARAGYLRLRLNEGGWFREASVHMEVGEADPADLSEPDRALVKLLAGKDLKKAMKKDLKAWADTHGDALRRPLKVAGLLRERLGRQSRMLKWAGLSLLLAGASASPMLMPERPEWAFWVMILLAGPLLLLAIIFALLSTQRWEITELARSRSWPSRAGSISSSRISIRAERA